MSAPLPTYACFDLARDGTRVRLLVQPKASRTELCGPVGDRLKVRLRSAPVEGKANAELLRFFRRCLGLSSGQIHLVAGERGRRKELLVTGLDPDEVQARLGLS